MKIIDILNKIAKNELPNKTKFKVYTDKCEDEFLCEYDKDYPGTIWCITKNGKFNYHIDFMRILNYEVEVTEEKKEIEELYENQVLDYGKINIKENREKINELVRQVNKLTKEMEAK